MRCVLYFDGTLDIEVLKKSIKAVADKFTIINSRFIRNPIRSYWKLNDSFDITDFLKVFETDASNHRSAAERYAALPVDPIKGPQMKAAVFRKTENGVKSDCLVLRFSHMIADGSGFSLFLKAFTDVYNNKLKNEAYVCKYGMGNRDYKQFYAHLSKEDRIRAKNMTEYRFSKHERLKFPLETYKENAGFERRLLTYKVDGFHAVRTFCKEHGFTFNDVILAAYISALMKRVEKEDGQTLAVDCILNLRRYMPADADVGFCNLVSKVKVNIGNNTGETFLDACKIVHAFMDKTKDNLAGLGGLTLLNLMDRIFPFEIGRILIKIFYQNPLIGLSNIGKVDKKTVAFGNLNVEDIVMTGTVKYTPYMLLSLITYEDSIRFCIASACTEKDGAKLRDLLSDVGGQIEKIAAGETAGAKK
jgi:NRPS condensation-like uncharacterized protein